MMKVEQYAALPAYPCDATVAYGDDPNQFAALYLPSTPPPHRIVIVIHGGCWAAKYDAKPMGALCRALTREGVAVWSLEYRRNGIGGEYPNVLLDVAAGADFLRTAASTYFLDLARVITIGHSAGGQLGLWLAARPGLPRTSCLFTDTPLPISGVVCLAGVIDLVDAAARKLCGDNLPLMMGGLPEGVPDRYQQASPMELLPIGVKQIHIVGDQDQMLPNVHRYAAAARDLGDDIDLITLPDTGHFELVDPTTAAWETVRASFLALQSFDTV